MKIASMIAIAAIGGLMAFGSTAASARTESDMKMHGRSAHRVHEHMKMHHHHHVTMKKKHHMMMKNHMGNHKMY